MTEENKYAQDFGGEEECEKIRHVVSKYGVQVVCNEEEEEALHQPDMVLHGDGWDGVKKVAAKVGYQVVSEEE